MFPLIRANLAIAAILATGSVVHAVPNASAREPAVSALSPCISGTSDAFQPFWATGTADADVLVLPASASGDARPLPDDRIVVELPPLPGSADLFLSAVLTVGAWQVVRSVRHLNLAGLPDWYHTGGPDQIGHAVAFDFDLATPAACPYAEPTSPRPASLFPTPPVRLPNDSSTAHLRPSAPRAPPVALPAL